MHYYCCCSTVLHFLQVVNNNVPVCMQLLNNMKYEKVVRSQTGMSLSCGSLADKLADSVACCIFMFRKKELNISQNVEIIKCYNLVYLVQVSWCPDILWIVCYNVI